MPGPSYRHLNCECGLAISERYRNLPDDQAICRPANLVGQFDSSPSAMQGNFSTSCQAQSGTRNTSQCSSRKGTYVAGPRSGDPKMSSHSRYYIGCAGWSLPKKFADAFPAEGSHLVRYAARLPAVEINSSFYRPHRPTTYEKWAASVPTGFRFSVKVPKWITHERRLNIEADELKV